MSINFVSIIVDIVEEGTGGVDICDGKGCDELLLCGICCGTDDDDDDVADDVDDVVD